MELIEKFKSDKETLLGHLKDLEQQINELKTRAMRVQGAITYLNQNIEQLEKEAAN